MAKRENITNEEAAMALTKIEDRISGPPKTGQKLLRDRVERTFPEFIARVPAGLLNEVGLKRHYKLPETVKVLRQHRKKVSRTDQRQRPRQSHGLTLPARFRLFLPASLC